MKINKDNNTIKNEKNLKFIKQFWNKPIKNN